MPLIVRWPERTPRGATSDHVGYFGDFMATLAEVVGSTPPVETDSLSFLPVISGRTDAQKQHEVLYWEFYEGASAQAVRMGKWKAVRSPMQSGPMQVYDLGNDVSEQHDIADRHPEIVARAAAAMQRAHVPSPQWKVNEVR